ncbi:IclR family transcriptional regulator [Ktedonosporobacter rubrisoli]|uniref:IclR family transcriptional regulator n=1 Tax=Ktedonosporobacter rubrisoli TaxID=2509675 RepID=A0A4P6JV59_KTERU|nr:IclR family transcriptional regulator [Ktedonosporobacter rubrisoli]QBD78836.1 IclR family transcriptional regulator [Ktedonosporobacter rubrisoli]
MQRLARRKTWLALHSWPLPQLTRSFAFSYTVHMTERIIRHKEQAETTPAPMVERAFRLLDVLSLSEEGLTLSDLARALDMSKGSLHGLLKTLENSRVIEQSEERRYIPGPRLYELVQTYVRGAGLRHFALPAMQRLAAESAETVILGRVEPKGVRILESLRGESESLALHIAAPRGMRVPLLAGALGRVMLANKSADQRRAFLQKHPLPRFTPHAISDPEQFLATVAETEHAGFGIDHEEYLTGVNAVAAPIYGPDNTLIALLWIVGFASRFGEEALQACGPRLRAEADNISHALGQKV